MSIAETPATDAAVATYAAGRGITEVLHFTTDKGLLGIFATGAILSRDPLDTDQYIEHIYTPNCNSRLKDSAWTGFVNLSISRVNNWMLTRSQGWHSTEDLWWAVLALDPCLLADPGVQFCTTNNTYPSVRRGTGVSGLEAMFADSIEWGYYGYHKHRITNADFHAAGWRNPVA
jgi:ssDNA thymidine ADP-ribosyltransferase, DarT